MDFNYLSNGVFTIVSGVISIIFHRNLGDYATRLNEKLSGIKYDEKVWKFNRIGFLIFGIFFTISGIYALFK